VKKNKSQRPAKGGNPKGAKLHIDSLEGGRWTWRYVEPGVELHSNETYDTREHAADWARRAYPEVPVADEEGDAKPDSK
jgi:hypothetical protein